MRRLQYWIVGMCIWLFFLYNIEKLGQPVNLASFVYIFTLICATLTILLPGFGRLPRYWLLLAALPPFFLLKQFFGYEIWGRNLPITVTEICAIGLTIVLGSQIRWWLDEFKQAVTQLTVANLEKETYPFDVGQGRIYREIRRARRYQRPVALLAIEATEETVDISLNRFIQEAQQEIIRKYIAAHIARLLVEELQDSDVVTQRNNHFVTLLPETSYENAQEIARKLKAAAQESLGLDFKIGVSTFPDEAVTFESLLEKAETKMRSSASLNGQHELKQGTTKSILSTR